MAVRTRKPTSPGQRGTILTDYSSLHTGRPVRSLVHAWKRSVGRSRGRITTRHKGGGEKKLYRVIDFRQDKFDIPATVVRLEYDPFRSAFIALLQYKDGEKRYIVAYEGAKEGTMIVSSQKKLPLKEGNRMPLGFITIGTFVHNIELAPGRGGEMARSAGSYAKVLAQEGKYTHLVMPSSEVRMILCDNLATVGVVSNGSHREQVFGKAGRMRHRGIRPTVRGSAMNPVDHPHGGGEGRQPLGMNPKTRWGKPARGVKTRKRTKMSSKFILQRRKKNK